MRKRTKLPAVCSKLMEETCFFASSTNEQTKNDQEIAHDPVSTIPRRSLVTFNTISPTWLNVSRRDGTVVEAPTSIAKFGFLHEKGNPKKQKALPQTTTASGSPRTPTRSRPAPAVSLNASVCPSYDIGSCFCLNSVITQQIGKVEYRTS